MPKDYQYHKLKKDNKKNGGTTVKFLGFDFSSQVARICKIAAAVFIIGLFAHILVLSIQKRNQEVQQSLLEKWTLGLISSSKSSEQLVNTRGCKAPYNNSKWSSDLLDATNYTNFLTLPQQSFLPNYRNPCWYMENDKKGGKCQLYCLPYVYILGVEKCGTTDLYAKLSSHPDVYSGATKEPAWWCRKRMGAYSEVKSFERYTHNFRRAAQKIEKNADDSDFHPGITVDSTPTTLWYMTDWDLLPENKGLEEPFYITADYIKHVQPNAKFIIALRNPTDREFSDYSYMNMFSIRSAQNFHDMSELIINNMNECFHNHSLRHCVYTPSEFGLKLGPIKIMDTIKGKRIRTHASIYYIYIQDWFKVLPRKNFYIMRMEDYMANQTKELQNIFNFLDIDTPDEEYFKKMLNTGVVNKTYFKTKHMLNKTREMLNDFFRPYNQKLAKLLGDDRFLWKEKDDYYLTH